MTTRGKHEISTEEHAAMFRFLDAYDNQTYSNDVGGLLGQLSMLREGTTFAPGDERQWRKAVSLAVTAH
jgi:hypothetical protein